MGKRLDTQNKKMHKVIVKVTLDSVGLYGKTRTLMTYLPKTKMEACVYSSS